MLTLSDVIAWSGYTGVSGNGGARHPPLRFNWQTYYMFRTLQVTAGAKLIATAWFDNSAAKQVEPGSDNGSALGRPGLGRDAYTGTMISQGKLR